MYVPNENIFNDSRRYKVDYADVTTDNLSANIIADNLLFQLYEDRKMKMMLDEVICHRIVPNAVPVSSRYYETSNGFMVYKGTTGGWEVCLYWRDRSTAWFEKKHTNKMYQVELDEYAII